MRAWLLALALTGLLVGACDDDDSPEMMDTDPDGGTTIPPTGDMDAGGQDVDPVITNTGEACESDDVCMGDQAFCYDEWELPEFPTGGPGGPGAPMVDGGPMAPNLPDAIPLPGGYCSAECTQHGECGPKAGCVGTDLAAAIEMFAGMDVSSFIPTQCAKRCVNQDGCREGYICGDVLDMFGAGMGGGMMIPIDLPTYCLPEVDLMLDGGVPDGAVSDDAGSDDAG